MMYALIEIIPNTIREFREFGTDMPLDVTRKGIKWLPVEDTEPPYDPATQVKEGPTTAVLADRVTRVWTVRQKTAQEIDDEKTSRVDNQELIIIRSFLDHENRIRAVLGAAQVTETQVKNAMKGYIDAPASAPDLTKVAVIKGASGPVELLRFTASVTIGAISAAAFTDKTFAIPGLLAADTILSVTFTAGLLPATISYMPLRVSAADTLAVRFAKISTGSVTPPAPQAITVMVAR